MDWVQSLIASSVLWASPFNRTTRLNMLATSLLNERTSREQTGQARPPYSSADERMYGFGSVERLELGPGLAQRDQGIATDPDRLAVLLVVQAVRVRDRAGELDISEEGGQVVPRVGEDDHRGGRHLHRRPVIVGKVCRH